MSYSQNDEEAVLLAHFGNKADGTFLEIGAFHPTKYSNTRALIERGWSGVMVEMSPYALVDLVEAYRDNPRVCIVAGAVTVEPRPPVDSWLVPQDKDIDGALTTTEAWHRDKWAGSLAAHGRKHVPFVTATISMAELVSMLPKQVDLVSIDTEGTSVQVAASFDFDRFGVTAAVIEHDGADKVYMPASFRLAAVNNENAIFLR